LQGKKPVQFRTIAVFFILALTAAVAGASLRVYDYTENDPTFCINCHIMEQPFAKWQKSVHKDIGCHDCHYATIFEKNKMLLKSLVFHPTKVSRRPHGKILVPATMCIKCHWAGEKSIPKISQSTGHALHWFKASIECTACHAIKLHEFAPQQSLCVNCHESAKAMLAEMSTMVCTDCHAFKGRKLMPDATACQKCHAEPFAPKAGEKLPAVHRQFDCMTCHDVHHPEQPASGSCQTCHTITQKRGKHPIHLQALGNECLTCHKPHNWRIEKKDAEKLCSQCHEFRPLKSFGLLSSAD